MRDTGALALGIVSLSVYNADAMPDASQITQVLQAISRSESGAAEQLLPLVYEDLRRLAMARMANEMSARRCSRTALVHEAWLRLVANEDRTWQNRAHFFGAAAEAMRRILIENARRKSRLKHGGGQARFNIEDLELADSTPDDKVLLINEALESLEAQDPEAARIVVLEILRRPNQAGSGRELEYFRAHGGSPMGLCQGLAVAAHPSATLNFCRNPNQVTPTPWLAK